MLFDGYAGDPALTAATLVDGWFLTSDAGRLDEDGRLQVLGRLDDVVVSGGVNVPGPAVAARLREHPAVREAEVLGVDDPEWGQRVVAFVVGRPDARRSPRLGRRGPASRLGAAAAGAARRAAAAGQRQARPGGPAGARMNVFSIPMRTRFRGITVREGVLLRGDGGWGEWSPFLEYAAGGRRALAALRRGGGRRGLARAGARRRTGQRDGAGGRARAGARDRARRWLRARPRSRSPSPGSRRPTTRRGWRRCATRSGPTAGCGSTPTALGRSTRRSPRCGCSTGLPVAWSTSSSRAAPSRSWRRYGGGCRCRSRPTSRSDGPRTPTGCATSRRRTSPCSRCSRSAGCARACGSPRTSGCRSWCRRRWRRRSASRPGWPWRPRCRSCPTPAGWRRCSCSPSDVAVSPLLPVDGLLPVGPPEVDEAALARLAAAPERELAWRKRLAAVHGVRQDRRA